MGSGKKPRSSGLFRDSSGGGHRSPGSSLLDWLDLVCNFSSIHGFVWYTRFDNALTKVLILSFVTLAIFGLPILLVSQLILFIQDRSLNTAVEMHQATAVLYPNISICHAKYFDLRAMDGKASAFNASHLI